MRSRTAWGLRFKNSAIVAMSHRAISMGIAGLASGLRFIKGAKFKSLRVALSQMSEDDRTRFWDIQRANGTEIPMIVSVYPNSTYSERERDHQIYGALASTASMRRANFPTHGTEAEWLSM